MLFFFVLMNILIDAKVLGSFMRQLIIHKTEWQCQETVKDAKTMVLIIVAIKPIM